MTSSSLGDSEAEQEILAGVQGHDGAMFDGQKINDSIGSSEDVVAVPTAKPQKSGAGEIPFD